MVLWKRVSLKSCIELGNSLSSISVDSFCFASESRDVKRLNKVPFVLNVFIVLNITIVIADIGDILQNTR